MQNTLKINSLSADLKSFGLNPTDWIVEVAAQNEFLIINIDDPGFRLQGWSEKGRWDRIQMLDDMSLEEELAVYGK